MLNKEECEKALEQSRFLETVIRNENGIIEFYSDFDKTSIYKCFEQLINEHYELLSSLKYYLDTNEENGVVYIPEFIIEKRVYPRKEKIEDVD